MCIRDRYTAIGATGFGLSVLYPSTLETIGWTHEAQHIAEYHVWYHFLGSLWLSIGLVAGWALWQGVVERFTPIFAVQGLYKTIWLLHTLLPQLAAGTASGVNQFLGVIMLSFVLLDLKFVPWGQLMARPKQH
eukprot:TRINITY_DN395_c0_g1_i1.p1 TRINITY_DN395_c0_g1~~TRINITY_DN395_c0_g1_i1.p1  ORF type:complete len:133 (-),score=34.29 TRINITY_DN395_c0_g1_i1:254-652(-)